MKDMVWLWIVVILGILLGAGSVNAQGPYEWNLSFRGSPDPGCFQGGFFWSPPDTERVQVGPEFSYYSQYFTSEENSHGFSTEVVARYFGLKDVPLKLFDERLVVNTNWYIGLGLGARWIAGHNMENVGDFRTGFIFGEGPIWFGIGYEALIDKLLWTGINGNIDNRVFGEILIGVGHKKIATATDLSPQ